MNLICDDCLKAMDKLIKKGTTVDTVICDLPYYGVLQDAWDNAWQCDDDYLWWVDECIKRISKLMSHGNLILFCSRQFMHEICMMLQNSGYEEKRVIIWARKRMFNNTRGAALTSGYEPILFFSRGDSVFNMIKVPSQSNRKEYTEGTLKNGVNLSDVWTDISALPHNSKEKVAHPSQKPVALMERCVKLFTNEGDTVLDFCMGSGSTGVACKNLGRNFIGIESNEDYFKIAQERLK